MTNRKFYRKSAFTFTIFYLEINDVLHTYEFSTGYKVDQNEYKEIDNLTFFDIVKGLECQNYKDISEKF